MRILFFANTAWYIYNFRLPLARRLRSMGHDVVLVSPRDDYSSRLEAEGFRWRSIPMRRRSLNPLREALLLWRLVKLLRQEKPDIVHNFTIKCAVYGSFAATWNSIPTVVNAVAGLGFVFASSSPTARALQLLLRVMMRIAFSSEQAILILQNPDDVAALERLRIVAPSRIRLIRGSGVDSERFFPRNVGSELTGRDASVLFASRLLWNKGVVEYVEAARVLRNQGIAARFRLAGAPDVGNPASVPEDELNRWAAEGIVEIIGHVEDMTEELARTDIFVLPSYYGEGVPRSLVEAGACAIPLVATDMPGCREIVVHERTGLLVPARDVAALANAIRRLCEDQELARRLGSAARNKVLDEFEERIVLKRTIDVYAEFRSGRSF